MRLLCALATAALAVSSMGCQAIQQSSLGKGPTSQITQASYARPGAPAMRPMVDPTVGQASYACGGGCDDCCDDGCCGGCADGYCGCNIMDRGKFRNGRCPQCNECGPCNGCGPYGGCNGNSCVNGAMSALLDCNGCGGDRCYNFTPGPPVGQTAYPYYTVRGPRDFLARNPRSIGPTGAYGCQ